jgi:hypothetical protein
MRIDWLFTKHDIASVRNEVERHAASPLLADRRARNLSPRKEEVSRQRFWRALCMALLTTQQPSGPVSAVSRLLCTRPFPLAHTALSAAPDPAEHATDILIAFGGIRRHGNIGSELATNLQLLEAGEWDRLLVVLGALYSLVDRNTERGVANYLDDTFKGLGPKQARNVLQALGLTRYEIPIDSRIARWLRDHRFPVPVSAAALSDREYYCFVLDGVQRLCETAKVLPCELDGAVFASFDREEWKLDLVRF